MQAPTDILENKKFKAEILQKAEHDVELQNILIKKCEMDKKFFFNTFCWTIDPRLENPIIPFILRPRQEVYINWLDRLLERSQRGEKINAVTDKPRDVGATITTMNWCLWGYLFSNFSARVGSRKEDYVDKKGEQDTLFYKLDFVIERLPEWLLPKGFSSFHHRAGMLLKNPENSNIISGESANPNFGRGGRKSVIIFDEHGFWEWAKSSWESAGESTNFRLSISTPPESGRDSHFYKLLTGQGGRVEKFDFEWTDVPGRDETWLRKARETKSEEEFAREVLKSFDSTLKGKVYGSDLKLANFCKLDYDPSLPLFCSWDFGLDAVAIIWWQKDFSTNRLKVIDSYWNSDKTIDFYVPFVIGEIKSGVHNYKDWELDKILLHRKWSREITHYGDPDVKKRNLETRSSTKDVLMKMGIYVQSKNWAGRTWLVDIREKTKMSFRRLDIDELRNEYLISAMRNAKYPERREGSQATTSPDKPVHDWTSHFRTSYEYFCDNEPEYYQTKRDKDKILKEEDMYDKYDLF